MSVLSVFRRRLGKLAGLAKGDPRLVLVGVGRYAWSLLRRRGTLKVDGVKCPIEFSLGRRARLMYSKLYEPGTVTLIRDLLEPGDTFIDVGANIGYLSAVALGRVGPMGSVHSFEPVPQYFSRLRALRELNPRYSLAVNGCAVGAEEGRAVIEVSGTENIGWNTMVPHFMAPTARAEAISVDVIRLDRYISKNRLEDISLIKIDTEGFELPVLRGLVESLDAGLRPSIICEVAPAAYPLLDTSLKDLTRFLEQYNYKVVSSSAPHETIDLTRLSETTNLLFLPTPPR